MPVDPEVQRFLDDLKAANAPPLSSLTPAEARGAFVVEDAKLLGPGLAVAGKVDCRVPGPDGEIPIRIYTPIGQGPFGALVYFHGGGWVIGDVASHDALASTLCNLAGCVVVSVEYRLAPEHKYPAAAEDAFAATQWVFDHAAELGVKPGMVAVGGDSAGGNLAAAVTLMARDRRAFRPVFPETLVYPVTDYNFDRPSYRDNAEGYLLTRADMAWFWDQYLASPAAGSEPYASPLRTASLADLPPALVQTAEFDPLRDEGEEYAAKLRAAGVPVIHTRYHGMIHAFIRRTNEFTQAQAAIEEIAYALRRVFAAGHERKSTVPR